MGDVVFIKRIIGRTERRIKTLNQKLEYYQRKYDEAMLDNRKRSEEYRSKHKTKTKN